jgi:chromosome segregation ATPase
MIKKVGITALLVVVGLFALSKLGLLPYVTQGVRNFKKDVNGSIPPEMKLERLKDELSRLPEETRKYRSAIAQEMVEINKLKNQIAIAKANLKEREEHIKSVRRTLEANETLVTVDGVKIPREKVEASLTRKWESFKQAEAAVKSQEELLVARTESLDVAKARLATAESKKEELEATVARLESELRKLRLAQTRNDIPYDDSRLSKIVSLVDEVETQINVEKTDLEMQKAVFTDSVVDEALSRKAKADKALQEMDTRFGDSKVAADKK